MHSSSWFYYFTFDDFPQISPNTLDLPDHKPVFVYTQEIVFCFSLSKHNKENLGFSFLLNFR